MNPKNPNRLFPLFLIDDLETTKRYYVDKLGFTATFDMPQYLQVRAGDNAEGPELCFMKPDAFPDGKPRPSFTGQGALISIPVDDADAAHDRMLAKGVKIDDKPTDKPWGWRSYFVSDPNGVVLDFFHVYKEVAAADMK
jgi:catechol 2,3-dioxygenase-like lactoylglutathione lyase family enzyme